MWGEHLLDKQGSSMCRIYTAMYTFKHDMFCKQSCPSEKRTKHRDSQIGWSTHLAIDHPWSKPSNFDQGACLACMMASALRGKASPHCCTHAHRIFVARLRTARPLSCEAWLMMSKYISARSGLLEMYLCKEAHSIRRCSRRVAEESCCAAPVETS